MANAQQLIEYARSVTPADEDILAAGVFAVQDDYIATALAAIGGSAAAGELLDSSLSEGLGAAAGVHAAREAHAAGQGVSVRMLLAVTPTHIRLFRLGTTGETPGEELMAFDRSACQITLGKFGAAEHVELREGAKEMKLTGGIGLLATYKDGNKKVVEQLGS